VPEPSASSGGFDLPQQRRLVDEVDEGPLTVDFDDRKPFPVLRFELGVAGDFDDLVLDPEAGELLLRPVAEAAAASREDDDPRDRARA
jgi:hypothetical protein